MDDDTPGNTAPQTHALTAVGVTAGVPTVGTPILRTRVVPDGWVSLDAALAWVAFGTAAPLDEAAHYIGAGDWPSWPPDALVDALRAASDPAAFKNFSRAGLGAPTYRAIWWEAQRNAEMPTPDDLANACARAAHALAQNLPAAREQCAKLARAAHRLRRAIAFEGLPAYGWRVTERGEAKGPFGLPMDFIGSARERIPQEVCAAPVTLFDDGIIPIIKSDWPEDGFAGLWRDVVIDAVDLLAAFPAPDDGAPTIAYHLTPPEKPKRGGGRPPHQGRQTFRKAMMRRANSPDGLGDMPACTRAMIEWAASKFGDRAPSETTIREWVREDWPED